MYHVARVHEWLERGDTFPIYMEASPAGACNHRCVFCSLDFMGYQPRYLDREVFLARIEELGRLGLKSLMFGGEGEPLLHKHIADFNDRAGASGMDTAFTTNGVLLREDLARRLLPRTAWIKVSLNAGRAETYAAIHRTTPEDFDKVIANLAAAARLRRQEGLRCTLGAQMILLPENAGEATTLAAIARDIGLDYLVVKPYSQHPQSRTERYKDIRYAEHLHLREKLQAFNSDQFHVVFRVRAMQKWDRRRRDSQRCLALPFWSYLDAAGNVWGCSMFLGDERFYYGNIGEESFESIWKGERRRRSLQWVHDELDACQCRVNCRMSDVGQYLWELKHPPEHVNFI